MRFVWRVVWEGCWVARAVIRDGSLRIVWRSVVLCGLLGSVLVVGDFGRGCDLRFVFDDVWEPAFFWGRRCRERSLMGD